MKFEDAQKSLRDSSTSEHEYGEKFERLIQSYFRIRMDSCQMWRDYAAEKGLKLTDTGIDLVARQGDTWWAVQVKGWKKDANITLGDVATMFVTAEAIGIKNKILVYTGGSISPNLQDKLKETGTRVIWRSDLEAAPIDWDLKRPIVKPPLTLRPHQDDAVREIRTGLSKADKGQCIMACGTGKTLTALHVAEEYHKVLYLVPSISLLKQTISEWHYNANCTHDYLVVCSDKTTTKEDASVMELPHDVTTDPDKIESWNGRGELNVVFSTYQSAGAGKYDLIIYDEAHRTAGKKGGQFASSLDIPARKRLFMTATPRVHKELVKQKANETNDTLYSMDDERVYGKVFYQLKFSEAITRGILSDYRVVMFQARAEDNIMDDLRLEDATRLASILGVIPHLRRVILFTNSIRRSKWVRDKIGDINMPDVTESFRKQHPEITKKGQCEVKVRHVDGTQSAVSRGDSIMWLKHVSLCKSKLI